MKNKQIMKIIANLSEDQQEQLLIDFGTVYGLYPTARTVQAQRMTINDNVNYPMKF